MEIPYENFGLWYMTGRKATHLSSQIGRSQCGLQRLGLRVKDASVVPLCKNCKRTVKIVKSLGKRVGIYKSSGEVTAWPETKQTEGN
jgi:hypothetical protein